jgi:hypothetical protein
VVGLAFSWEEVEDWRLAKITLTVFDGHRDDAFQIVNGVFQPLVLEAGAV